MALLFRRLLRMGEQAQFFIPLRFESIGDQAIVGIDTHVPHAGLLGVILQALYVLETKPLRFDQPVLDFTLDMQDDLQRKRSYAFDQ